MKKSIGFLTAIVILSSFSYAGAPVQNMSAGSFSLDYNGLWRGENITMQKVGANEDVQTIAIGYSPAPYLFLSVGLGVASYSVDTNTANGSQQIFYNGNFGIAPTFVLTAYTPYLYGKLVRITAGAKGYFLNTTDPTKQYGYGGFFATGGAGLVFSLGTHVDLEIGGRGLLVMGEMQQVNNPQYDFSNDTKSRGYLSVTVQTPGEGGYIALDCDASPDVTGDWSNGPKEASIGITAGVIFHSRAAMDKLKEPEEKNFPHFRELQGQIDTLRKELK
jgi:hypothetical protein